MQTQQHFHIYMYISHTYQEQKVSPDMLFTDSAPVGCSCKQNKKAQSMKMPFTQGICYGIFIICMQDRGQPK